MKKYVWIMIIVVSVVVIPFIVDRIVFYEEFPSNVDGTARAGFMGGYLGGIATLIALVVTINHNDKENRIQRDKERIKEIDRRKHSIRPYLYTDIKYFEADISFNENDRFYYIKNDQVEEVHYNLIKSEMAKISAHHSSFHREIVPIKYLIRNVGSGSAIDVIVSINGFDEEFAVSKYEEVKLLLMIYLTDVKNVDLNIVIRYSDCESLADYETKETIKVELKNDGAKIWITDKVRPHEI